MRNYFLLIISLVQTCFTMAQPVPDKKPYLVKVFKTDTIKEAEFLTSGGNISITGTNTAEVKIEVFVSPDDPDKHVSKKELAKRFKEYYELKFSAEEDRLLAFVQTKNKSAEPGQGLHVSFNIFIPQHFSARAGTSGGNISVKNGEGNFRLNTSGGSINMVGLKGVINTVTSGGNISGEKIDGELIAHVSQGNIDLKDLSCSLQTSGNGGALQVSFNGLGKYINMSNLGGKISLYVPKNEGMDLDLKGKVNDPHFQNFNGQINEYSIKGKLNGGGIPVGADTNRGQLTISLL